MSSIYTRTRTVTRSNDRWDKQNGWSGGLLQLAVGDDAAARAARAARHHALLVTLLRRALLRGAAAR